MSRILSVEKGVKVRPASGPWVEINLGRLEENIGAVRGAVGAGTEVMFVVKSNAYGHGLVPIACRAVEAGIRWLGVAYGDEARVLRAALPGVSILVMGAVAVEEVEGLLKDGITVMVVSEEHGMALGEEAVQLGGRLAVHVKVDTGMGRLGVGWEEGDVVMDRLAGHPGLEIRGMCTHFATVEKSRPGEALTQMSRFKGLRWHGAAGLFRHVASSRAFLYHPAWDLEGIRPGILLYGYGADGDGMRVRTAPILEWKTRVIQVKRVQADCPIGYYGAYRPSAPTMIGVIAVGYSDGYHRLLSNKGHVLIRGKRRPVIGRVSMNWVTVDMGQENDVQTGDEVVLLGRQGSESIWAGELATLCRTIPYEILASIPGSTPRVYH